MFYDIDDNLFLSKDEYVAVRLKNDNNILVNNDLENKTYDAEGKRKDTMEDTTVFVPKENINNLEVTIGKFETTKCMDRKYIENFKLILLDGYQNEIETYDLKLNEKENKILLEDINFKPNRIYIIKVKFDFSNIEGFVSGQWLYNIRFNIPEVKEVPKGDNMGADTFLKHVSEILKEDGVSFSKALKACKDGKRIQRKGWNGKGMFVYYVGGDSYPAKTKAAKNTFKDNVPYLPYLALKTADDNVVPWTISQTDALAEDWVILQ